MEVNRISEYCAVVFVDGIKIQENNNYKSVVATRNIKTGELLLIEHACATQLATLFAIVAHNEYIFDQYHPRITKWRDEKNRDKMAQEKVQHNSFNFNNLPLMTDFIAKCNHYCDPNCAISPSRTLSFAGEYIAVFMEVFAVKDIIAGQEIMISYGPETGHQRDFTCNCKYDLSERTKLYSATADMAALFSKVHADNIDKLILEYRDKKDARRIMMNQYLAQNGIVVNNGRIVGADKTIGGKLITDVIRMNAKNTDQNMRTVETFLKYMQQLFFSKDLIFF